MTDEVEDCKHLIVKRSVVGAVYMYRCADPKCGKLFSLVPYEITVKKQP